MYSNVRDDESAAQITPLKTLGVENGAPLSLLELSNGPTLAFKDMAMQLLGNLFEYALAKHGETLNILGATSGDTGSAAEYAMRGKTGHARVHAVAAQEDERVPDRADVQPAGPEHLQSRGRRHFDDCQDIVKAVSNDHAFKAKHKIGTVNSINWARVVAQVVYYFKGYFAATKSNDERVSFTVPSGNFGNVCAGHIARMMGLPIEQLVVATNENDVLDEFFRTGIYRVRKAAETYHTTQPEHGHLEGVELRAFRVRSARPRSGARAATVPRRRGEGRFRPRGERRFRAREGVRLRVGPQQPRRTAWTRSATCSSATTR